MRACIRRRNRPDFLDAFLPVVVPVMRIRVVRVRVTQRLMAMPMRMRFAHRPLMRMLMMRVMNMDVIMFKRAVVMFVFVPFGEMKP